MNSLGNPWQIIVSKYHKGHYLKKRVKIHYRYYNNDLCGGQAKNFHNGFHLWYYVESVLLNNF